MSVTNKQPLHNCISIRCLKDLGHSREVEVGCQGPQGPLSGCGLL